MENFSKCPVRPYTSCTGQILYVHWFPSWKLSFDQNSIAVQSWEYVNWNLDFINGGPYINYGEFFKVPCTTVHELYRSNLVCPLIPIWKAVFWSKQHNCTVLGSMLTGISILSMEGPILAMENSSKCPVLPYTTCTRQIWYVHLFPSWNLSFSPNSIAVQSWEVC